VAQSPPLNGTHPNEAAQPELLMSSERLLLAPIFIEHLDQSGRSGYIRELRTDPEVRSPCRGGADRARLSGRWPYAAQQSGPRIPYLPVPSFR